MYFPNSICVEKSFPFHVLTILKQWVRRHRRRGCSDEGKREGQELTSECVLTTPRLRSLTSPGGELRLLARPALALVSHYTDTLFIYFPISRFIRYNKNKYRRSYLAFANFDETTKSKVLAPAIKVFFFSVLFFCTQSLKRHSIKLPYFC